MRGNRVKGALRVLTGGAGARDRSQFGGQNML